MNSDNKIINISYVDLTFFCPKCSYPYYEEDYMSKFEKSIKPYIYTTCKGCKTKIGITFDIMGNVQAWLKEDEIK